MLDLKSHFSRFSSSDPQRLHFAAHSHHPWPDVSREAHMRAWDDAACLIDGKWERILGEVLPAAQRHIGRQLGLSDPTSVVFAPNTHELLMRLLSCCPVDRPVRVLTSDSEFHSFTRQIARLEEDGLVQVCRVAAEPFDSFAARFVDAASAGSDLIYLSQVFSIPVLRCRTSMPSRPPPARRCWRWTATTPSWRARSTGRVWKGGPSIWPGATNTPWRARGLLHALSAGLGAASARYRLVCRLRRPEPGQ